MSQVRSHRHGWRVGYLDSLKYAAGEERRISELFCADRCQGQSGRTRLAPAEGISRSSSTNVLRRGIAATQPGAGNINLTYDCTQKGETIRIYHNPLDMWIDGEKQACEDSEGSQRRGGRRASGRVSKNELWGQCSVGSAALQHGVCKACSENKGN